MLKVNYELTLACYVPPFCYTAIDCGTIELGTLQNGLIMNSETTYNSVATYTCNDGYILNGNATRTCLETGLWSGSVPTCTSKQYIIM